MQYSLAICESKNIKEHEYKGQHISANQYQTKFQFNRDEHHDLEEKAESKDKRIEELEQQLKRQTLQYQNELDKQTAKTEQLEKSILVVKEVCKLQDKCKRLYHDGDERVLQRIGDISDRAARRLLDDQG